MTNDNRRFNLSRDGTRQQELGAKALNVCKTGIFPRLVK
jgi:hypothetical protein